MSVLVDLRVFRIVHAPIFLRSFASDRRHMKDSEGNWTYEPPPHEPLVAEGKISGSNYQTIPFVSDRKN